MVTFYNISDITSVPGIYNEYRKDLDGHWELMSQHIIVKNNNVFSGTVSASTMFTEDEIYMIGQYQEENGLFKYELQNSENKYCWSDGSIHSEKEPTDKNLPF